MPFGSWEWIVILLVVAAIILWGPKKIPEFANAIGRARGEFERASREAMTNLPPVEGRTESRSSSGDDLLIETARKLNISTEGKTKEQISKEIVEKFKAERS
ncbi:MAG: twin-arginine translocase TatA/TatE family subunit [Candidatus Bathyarchaeia archaeon]